jgi:hypothetical protein
MIHQKLLGATVVWCDDENDRGIILAVWYDYGERKFIFMVVDSNGDIYEEDSDSVKFNPTQMMEFR